MYSRSQSQIALVAALVALVVIVLNGTADAAKTQRGSSVVTVVQPDLTWTPSMEDCTLFQWPGFQCVLLGPLISVPATRTPLALRSVVLAADVTVPSGPDLGMVADTICEEDFTLQWVDAETEEELDYLFYGSEFYGYPDTPAQVLNGAWTRDFADLNDTGALRFKIVVSCGGATAFSPTKPITINNIRLLISTTTA